MITAAPQAHFAGDSFIQNLLLPLLSHARAPALPADAMQISVPAFTSHNHRLGVSFHQWLLPNLYCWGLRQGPRGPPVSPSNKAGGSSRRGLHWRSRFLCQVLFCFNTHRSTAELHALALRIKTRIHTVGSHKFSMVREAKTQEGSGADSELWLTVLH